MANQILKELQELQHHGVIDGLTADRIKSYYQHQQPDDGNRLLTIFSVIGSALISMGIILILAHNWDTFPRTVKTFLAFAPLLIGQAACAFTLLKRKRNKGWREGASVFLVFAIAASISLVSQIYHIEGDMVAFILTWLVLAFPLIYVMRSRIAAILYLFGITWYSGATGYLGRMNNGYSEHWYWLMLLMLLPAYYWAWKKKPLAPSVTTAHFLVPLSITFSIGNLVETEFIISLLFISLFSIFYQIGKTKWFADLQLRKNGYRVIGSVGTVITLLTMSFSYNWRYPFHKEDFWSRLVSNYDFWIIVILLIVSTILLLRKTVKEEKLAFRIFEGTFIIYLLIFFIGQISPEIAYILVNLLLLFLGVMIIRLGIRDDHLLIVNYGLLIITSLIFCRFVDTDLSFVWRGVIFVLVGVGFFITNRRLLQQRKLNQQNLTT